MFYDLIIHPSRVEFVHRVFSPEKNDFIEKKLGSVDLKYKFDAGMIDNGEHFEAFKQIIKELVDPYKSELNSINIIVRSSFFQMKSVVCDQNKADYMEYINWEVYQLITDQPENYKFGYVFLEHDKRLILALVRKTVFDYFSGVMRELYSGRIDCKLGCIYSLSNNKDIYVFTDKQLVKPFKPEITEKFETAQDYVPSPAKSVKSVAFLLILFMLFIASVAVALLYYAPDFTRNKIQQLASLIPASEKSDEALPINAAPAAPVAAADTTSVKADTTMVTQVTELPQVKDSVKSSVAVTVPVDAKVKKPLKKPEQKPAAVPAVEVPAVDPSLDPHPKFWDYLIALSKVKSDSIVFNNGTGNGELSFFSSDQIDMNKAREIPDGKSYQKNITDKTLTIKDNSFFFINSRKRSNYNRFLEVKAQLGIKSRKDFPNVFRLTSLEELHKFMIGLKNNNVGFKKFVIEKTDDFISFTVYFG